jgi:hypothetical protein
MNFCNFYVYSFIYFLFIILIFFKITITFKRKHKNSIHFTNFNIKQEKTHYNMFNIFCFVNINTLVIFLFTTILFLNAFILIVY